MLGTGTREPLLDHPVSPAVVEGRDVSGVHEETTVRARLLTVDDHAFMREGIKAIVGRTSLEVVGEAQDGEEALACCRELRPDLILTDISMPRMDGIEATRRIQAQLPETSVLILTANADHRLLTEAVKAEAAGYLLKGGHTKHVLDAVKAVLEGETPLTRRRPCCMC